jgi:hypothetical protein
LVSVILGTASAAQNVGAIAALGVGGYIALAGLWAAPVRVQSRTFGAEDGLERGSSVAKAARRPALGKDSISAKPRCCCAATCRRRSSWTRCDIPEPNFLARGDSSANIRIYPASNSLSSRPGRHGW